MVSVDKRVSVFIMILICFVWDGSSSPCKNPQYIELYQPGVIQCSFDNGFVGIQWFNSTEDGTKPIITFVRSEKGGSGYISGDYDILPNGSLIITNVTLQHERVFSVVLAASEDKPTIQYIVRVETIVTPEQPYPTIKQCPEESTPCYRDYYTPSLNCIVRSVRPEASLTWSQRMVEYDSLLKSELFVTAENKHTFTSLATVNLTKTIPLLSFFTCKLTGIEFQFDEYEASIIVENTNIHLNTDPIKFNVELYSTMVLPCTELQPNIIVWKGSYDVENISQIIITKVKNWKDDFNTTYNEDFLLGPDGSLVLKHVDWHYSGIYSCLVTDFTKMDTKIFDVIVFVNPSPPYLMIEGCNRQQYCVIEVQRGGNITCSIFGIRPAVQLQWRSYDKEADIHFNGEHINTIKNGDTFDISITTSFKITSTIAERLTLQCLTVGKNSELFQFSTKLDILPIFDKNIDVLLSSSGTAWIIAGSIAAITVVSVLVAIFCKVTRRSKTAQNCDKQSLEEEIPMVDPERETTTATDEKTSDKIKEYEEDAGFLMLSQKETTTAADEKTSDKINEDEADTGFLMLSQKETTATTDEETCDKNKEATAYTRLPIMHSEREATTAIDEKTYDINKEGEADTAIPVMKHAREYEALCKTCVIHNDQISKGLCVFCKCEVCPVCLLSKSHEDSDCDLINFSDVSDEIFKRRKGLSEDIQVLQEQTQSIMKLWDKHNYVLKQCQEVIPQHINKVTLNLLQDIEERKQRLMIEIDEKEEAEVNNSVRESKRIQNLRREVDQLSTLSNIPTKDALEELHCIQKNIDRIKNIQSQLAS